MKAALTADHSEGAIWLVSENLPQNGVTGMVRCLRREPGGHRFRCVSEDAKSSGGVTVPAGDVFVTCIHCLSVRTRCIFNASSDKVDLQAHSGPSSDSTLFETLAEMDLVMNVHHDGQWGSFRHLPLLDGTHVRRCTFEIPEKDQNMKELLLFIFLLERCGEHRDNN